MEELRAVANQLGLNSSFVPLFILVVSLYFVLSELYFKPFQKLILDRRAKTSGAKEEAIALVSRAEEMMQKYLASIRGSYDEARKIANTAEQDGKAQESKLLSEASLKAKVFIQNANAEMESQKRNTIEELKTTVPGIAAQIVEKVLGRSN